MVMALDPATVADPVARAPEPTTSVLLDDSVGPVSPAGAPPAAPGDVRIASPGTSICRRPGCGAVIVHDHHARTQRRRYCTYACHELDGGRRHTALRVQRVCYVYHLKGSAPGRGLCNRRPSPGADIWAGSFASSTCKRCRRIWLTANPPLGRIGPGETERVRAVIDRAITW
jgi:hypothetical protein